MADIHAIRAFDDLVTDYQEHTGFEMPLLLKQYLVILLADRIDRVDLMPGGSFAETYLKLYQAPRPGELKMFGDDCLFFVSLLPEWGHRRGLNVDYFASLGISSYYTWGDLTGDARATQLGNWFYHLQKFLNSVLKNTELVTVRL